MVIKEIVNNRHYTWTYGKTTHRQKHIHIDRGCFFHDYFPREWCDYDSVMLCTINNRDVIVCTQHSCIITNYNNKKLQELKG